MLLTPLVGVRQTCRYEGFREEGTARSCADMKEHQMYVRRRFAYAQPPKKRKAKVGRPGLRSGTSTHAQPHANR